MAEDRIVKFCAQIGPRNICLVITNCPPGGRDHWSRSHDILIFWQMSVNILKTVQDRDILTMED